MGLFPLLHYILLRKCDLCWVGLYINNNPYLYDYDTLATDGYTFKGNVAYSFVSICKFVSCNLIYITILTVNSFFYFVSYICPATSFDNQELSGCFLPPRERRKSRLVNEINYNLIWGMALTK